jgi:DNA-binding transcriptional MerR regulator
MDKQKVYGSKEAATLYGVTEQTIRSWAEEFSRHLSVLANPGNRRTRQFSHEDMSVLALIAEHKKRGTSFADIHAALENGERGEFPDEMALMLTPDEDYRLSVEIEYLKRQVDELRRQRDEAQKLAAELDHLRIENARLLAKIEALEREIGKAQELGRAQGELAALRRLLEERGGFGGSSSGTSQQP